MYVRVDVQWSHLKAVVLPEDAAVNRFDNDLVLHT